MCERVVAVSVPCTQMYDRWNHSAENAYQKQISWIIYGGRDGAKKIEPEIER